MWAAELVRRVAAGDASALEQLYDRYARPGYSLARGITGDTMLAEEAVQDVFLAVWRQPTHFRPGQGGFASWLLAAVHNKAVDAVRREQSARRRVDAARAAKEFDASDAGELTENLVEDKMRGEQVRHALRALPPNQREALVLAYYGGYTQSEIAALTDTPLGTVKTRMYRALHHLRDTLDDLSQPAAAAAGSVRDDDTTPGTR